MLSYAVIEVDDGLTVVEVDENSTPEQEAERYGGVLVEPTCYSTYEDAYDAMLIINAESNALSDNPPDL